ncbi:MAG TPA: hypothetical protein VFN62_01490 [Acidobacteriaceae bacterium]|nr:hypothetical protein [Acidobacteriaceae bacterium]
MSILAQWGGGVIATMTNEGPADGDDVFRQARPAVPQMRSPKSLAQKQVE